MTSSHSNPPGWLILQNPRASHYTHAYTKYHPLDEVLRALRPKGLTLTRVKIEKINNLLQVDIDRREQGCAAHYEQYCQHGVTTLFNCNNLEQHG
jgi:hypothetical protein